jgi:hypothetical protein
MKAFGTLARALLVLGLSLLTCSCSKSPPPVTEVEGTLLLNEQPLPNALVQFMPETSDFGAEVNSTAVTDDKGHFTLTCAVKNQPGAVVGKHRVVVTEASPPADIRRQQDKVGEYQNKLKNRPIPPLYSNYSDTTLRVEVTAGQKDYTVKMTR